MLKSYRFILFIVILFLFVPTYMYGQNSSSTSSPYSKYGFGRLSGTSFGRGDAMGGIGIGIRNGFQVNTANPASYTSIDSLTFLMQFGLDGRYTYSETTESNNFRNDFNFNHLTFGVPIKKWWAGSFGLLPYSSKGYGITSSDGALGLKTTDSFTGTGTLTKVYIGNAFKLGKNLSLGVNTWFMFGKLIDNVYVYYPFDNNTYDYYKDQSLTAHGFGVTTGLQYQITTPKGNNLVLGATFEPKINVNSKYVIHEERALFRASSSASAIVDTIQHTISKNEGLQTPMAYGFGFSYTIRNKITFGADAYFSQWQDLKFLGQSVDYLTNNSKYSAGIEYIPNQYSIQSYWERVNYRGGAYVDNSYLTINGMQIRAIAGTFGFGFPLGRSRTTLNIAMEIGRLGTTENELIRETYAKMTIHLMLHDRWFFKTKFD